MNSRFDKIAPGLPNKLHFLVDAALAVTALCLAQRLKMGFELERAGQLSVVALGTWMVVAAVTRLYSPHTPRRLYDYLALRLLAVGGVTSALMLGDRMVYATAGFDPLVFFGLFYAAGAVTRVLVFKPLSRIATDADDVLIVGTGPLGVATYENLRRAPPEHRRRVIGFVRFTDGPQTLTGINRPVLGSVEDMHAVLSENPVSEVYFAGRVMEHGAEMQQLAEVCERVGMPFAVPVHSLRFERARLMSSSPATDGYLHYMSTAHKPVQYTLKRLIDISASAFALLVLSPLLVGVAVGIKLTSKGPVFFRQNRLGLHGCSFGLLKFRSMVVNAEELKAQLMENNEQSGPVFKMKRDPRITRVGRFIRKYSIDELPQLVNILRGDMTIVGPRPALPKEVAQYKAWQRRRLSVRPGLTCYWQVGGRNEIGFDEWMRLDLRYVDHWNIGVDVQLILQTFPVVLAGKGAS